MQVSLAPRVLHLSSFYSEAAGFILGQIRLTLEGRSFCRLALSGGETPREVNRELVRQAGDLPWERLQITFGDERCVAADHADSNYEMARVSLLSQVPIPAGNVFRLRGEVDPAMAALEYEAKLGALANRVGESVYVHDLILLGLGPDGHTASLFPGSSALDETRRHILPVIGPKPPPQRLTMTFPLINAARHVCFLVKGGQKLPIVQEIVAGRSLLPAARVRPGNGAVTWLTGS